MKMKLHSRWAALLLSSSFLFGLQFHSTAHAQPASPACVWKDAKTRAVVPDYPAHAEPDPSDPNRAFRSDTGVSFRREGGVWRNAQNGAAVPSYPYRAERDPTDPNRAHRPDTGENFYRECINEAGPPQPRPPLPPGGPPPGGGPPPQPNPPPDKKGGLIPPDKLPVPLPAWLAKWFRPQAAPRLGPVPAGASLDPCLVGQWLSQPVGANMLGVTGGGGILLTFKADGTQTVAYTGMQPFVRQSGESNLWTGSAEGHIATRDGKASVVSVERSDISHKFEGPGISSSNSLSGGMGPAGLGNNRFDPSYECTETRLSFKDPARTFIFIRLDKNGVPLETTKAPEPTPTAKPEGLSLPGLPENIRKACEPDYSRAMAEADEKARDAALTRRAADTFRSSGMSTRKAAQGDRQLAEQAEGTLMKAMSNGDTQAVEAIKQQIEVYKNRALHEEASAEYDLQRAASSEQRAQALEQEAAAIRKQATQDCLSRSGGNP